LLIVTDVYPSREQPIEGVSGEMIAKAAINYGHRQVHYQPDKTQLPTYLKEICKEGDIVITMGAGDIYRFGDRFLQELKEEGMKA
jgi:UDP-N-acetylmuramate--alanine ligase